MTKITAVRALDFTSSIGVNAPIAFTDGNYSQIKTVLADLSYIGVNLIRTNAYHSDMSGHLAYNTAASSGIRFDMVLAATNSLSAAVTQLANFQTAHPGAIASIEGPNEINNFPANYMGLTGPAAAIKFQNDLYAAVNANPVLAGTTVDSYTMGAGAVSTTGYDYAAIHPYAVNGRPMGAYIAANLKTFPAGIPFTVTETGYSTATASSGVDQRTQAKLTLDAIFDAKKAGAADVFLYQLLDAYADPGGNTSLTFHYGLYDFSNQPKLLATALHNLMVTLSDTGTTAATFTAGSLNYSIANADATAQNMLLEKSSGIFDLVLWDEQTIWNATTRTEITATTHNELVNLGGVVGQVSIYDPLSASTPISTLYDVSSVTVAVSDHPVIVAITPLAATINAIDASAGHMSVTAAAAGSLIVGGAGDTLTGGAGADTFVFHAGFGLETVAGFTASGHQHDTLQFDSSLFGDWAHLLGATKQQGSDLLITYDAKDSVLLKNVSLASFTASDTHFV